jgi:hypothetical protein
MRAYLLLTVAVIVMVCNLLAPVGKQLCSAFNTLSEAQAQSTSSTTKPTR